MKKNTLNHIISIRIADDEWEIIRAIAVENKISVSDLVRTALGLSRDRPSFSGKSILSNFRYTASPITGQKRKQNEITHNNRSSATNRPACLFAKQGEAE